MITTCARACTTALVLPVVLSVAAGGLTTAAQAENSPPTIERITTVNESGGLTPYIPLYTSVSVEFTDPTPSTEKKYEVVVPGVKTTAFVHREADGNFTASFPIYDLEFDQPYDIAVRELDADGDVVARSESLSWTPSFVKHPRAIDSNVRENRRGLTYTAGKRARLWFKGKVEPGATVTTRVWVGKRKNFTDADMSANTTKNAALVDDKEGSSLVPKFKIPKKLAGKYLWISVLIWKDGKAGWRYTLPPIKVVRR